MSTAGPPAAVWASRRATNRFSRLRSSDVSLAAAAFRKSLRAFGSVGIGLSFRPHDNANAISSKAPTIRLSRLMVTPRFLPCLAARPLDRCGSCRHAFRQHDINQPARYDDHAPTGVRVRLMSSHRRLAEDFLYRRRSHRGGLDRAVVGVGGDGELAAQLAVDLKHELDLVLN